MTMQDQPTKEPAFAISLCMLDDHFFKQYPFACWDPFSELIDQRLEGGLCQLADGKGDTQISAWLIKVFTIKDIVGQVNLAIRTTYRKQLALRVVSGTKGLPEGVQDLREDHQVMLNQRDEKDHVIGIKRCHVLNMRTKGFEEAPHLS
jgi:hypothetical protein